MTALMAGLRFSREVTVTDLVTLCVALATLGLALTTLWLVKWTKKEAQAVAEQVTIGNAQVKAENKQIAVSTDALRASIRPWLTVPRGQRKHGSETTVGEREAAIHIRLPLRNIGNGIAFLQEATFYAHWDREHSLCTSEVHQQPYVGLFTQPVIQSGEETAVEFFAPLRVGEPSLPQLLGTEASLNGHFEVHVLYADADGKQAVLARVRAAHTPQGWWWIYEISYEDPDGSILGIANFRSSEQLGL